MSAIAITVEPVLFLYMLSMFMTLTALQDLIYIKVCLNKYSINVCDHLYEPENIIALDEVQASSSHWILSSTLMLALPSIVSAQFIGFWSDTYGRKIPMLLPPIGGVFATLVYIGLSIYLQEWPVSLILLASAITGLCGGFTSCILTCMSYLSQVTSIQSRTVRVSILESMLFISGSVGPVFSGWIQDSLGRGSVFLVIMSIHSAIVLYIVIFVRNIPPRQPPPLPWLKSACNCKHLRDSLLTVVRPRQENRRSNLLLLIAAAAIIMLCTSGEIDLSYIYVKDNPIKWSLDIYSQYFSLKYGLSGFSLIFILPLLRRLPDSFLIIIGLTSKMFGLLLLAFAKNSATVYSAAVMSSMSSWSVPVLRSAMSKHVEANEQGKMFACVAMVESACSLIASGLFNSIYPATRHQFRGLTFVFAAALLLIPFIITCYLHSVLKTIGNYDKIEEGEEAKEIEAYEESSNEAATPVSSSAFPNPSPSFGTTPNVEGKSTDSALELNYETD